jgi:integral membrane protein
MIGGMPSDSVPAPRKPTVREPDKARAAVGRYRVMAYITGVMLLILCVEILLKYVVQVGPDVLVWIKWIPQFHGFVYIVYLVTVLDLWSKLRWGFGRLIVMVLGGVVPIMSFVVERRVHTDAEALLGPATTLAQ